MGRRMNLNSLPAVERSVLVNLILDYLTDAVVSAHNTITHNDIHIFTGHRAYIEGLEAFLSSRGASRFVPLPKWNPANPIPNEFNVVRPQDNGTARAPLQNLNPNRPMPSQFAFPAVCSFTNGDDLGNAVNPWHGGVHGAVGGTFGSFPIASAAPIFWCWHAFVDDIYHDWQQCSGWSDVKAVPGWFGSQDQGADIAIRDINGNGRPDLVVFHIDNPGGENHGYYRLGWNLDTAGNVTGGWSNVKLVPGWFGAEDQGAGIALFDINGNGRPDLVVFHVDNPGGENHGYYRIGWNLSTTGNVTSGWSDIKAVPGWFGAENQGAAIALADINGNGRPDLIIFHIDNPGGENHGYYRIGWNLDTNGNVTGGWSNIKPIPGWFGAEDQGAGIALVDINGNGRPDLVVFHLDNPGGENHGYYRIGWNLSIAGNVTGWSDINLVRGWFGAENQGAGLALADINGDGRRDLVVFHVDNPAGENHGYYRIGWRLSP